MNLIRILIFNGLRARFPGFKDLLIYPSDKKVIISYSDGKVQCFATGNTDEKYFTMLAESKDLKEIKSIYVSQEKDCILIRGDKDVML